MFKVAGTTNIQNAIIQITAKKSTDANPTIVATLRANSNGYWEYFLTTELTAGSYVMQIMVTDPDDSSRVAFKNYFFNVLASNNESISSSGGGGSHHGSTSKSILVVNSIGKITSSPITQTSSVGNGGTTTNKTPVKIAENVGVIIIDLKNDKIYRGQDMQLSMIFADMDGLLGDSYGSVLNLKYEFLNERDVVVFSNEVSEEVFGNKLEKTMHVPEDLPNGNYVVRVSLAKGQSVLSGESSFVFSEMPVINLGGGIMLTYSQLESQIGWFAITSSTALLFFGFMFLIEYYFFKEAIFTVDESNLFKKGMISSRRGVSP